MSISINVRELLANVSGEGKKSSRARAHKEQAQRLTAAETLVADTARAADRTRR